MTTFDDIRVVQKRQVLYVVAAIIFLVFGFRLYQLQMIYSEEYGKKSEENSIRNIPLEPIRGYMYDRNGRLLVDNRPAFTVTIMPFEYDTRNTRYLASILHIDESYIRDRLKKGIAYSRFAPTKILRDISFPMLATLEENRDRLPGVSYQIESKRFYVTDALASHILGYTKEISEAQMKSLGEGYTQGDVVGSAGLERRYEDVLRGKKGAEFSTVNVRGQVIGRFNDGLSDVPAVEGNDLLLTLDCATQALAESLMSGKRGAFVALDTRNGGIIAMVSKPDYDLSIFSGVTPPEVWHALNADEAKPLFNRATLTRYPPGSTYKMILALAALESNTVTPNWRITCGGSFRLGNKVFKDLHVHGSTNMVEAIQRSCNVYFYQLMLKVGLDTWATYGSEFGFGKLTGVDLFEESPGLLPTTAWMNRRYGPQGWTRGFLPSLGIGQGELGVTPLQMACYAMVLANKGKYHQPHAVRSFVEKADSHRTVESTYSTRTIHLSETTWEVIREGMRRVVQEPGGTASLARIRGIQVAGKTGTAENPHGKDHSWFVGFAPYDNPVIAVAVMVENIGYGGSFAAPMAGQVMEQFIFGRLIRFDRPAEKEPLPITRNASRTPDTPDAVEGN